MAAVNKQLGGIGNAWDKLTGKFSDEAATNAAVDAFADIKQAMIDAYDDVIGALEWELEKTSRRQDRRTLMLLSMVGQSMPIFWVGLLMIFVFAVERFPFHRFLRGRIRACLLTG